jgi:hypothetical protein
MACPGFGQDYRTCRIADVVYLYNYVSTRMSLTAAKIVNSAWPVLSRTRRTMLLCGTIGLSRNFWSPFFRVPDWNGAEGDFPGPGLEWC